MTVNSPNHTTAIFAQHIRVTNMHKYRQTTLRATFGRRKIGEIVRCLPDKKTKCRLALQLSLLRGSRPKSTGASPRQCRPTPSAPDFIQIGLLSEEL